METRENLKRCGRTLSERGLVWGRSGNISARAESNAFLISAAGAELGALRDEDLVVCRTDSDSWEGARRPSIERNMHRGIYQACEQAKAVIHSQPFYSTLVACSDLAVRTDLFPEAMAYLGEVGRVPYHHAGSPELAEAATQKARSCQVMLLENHGVLCWGSSLDGVLLRTATLEFLCRLLVVSQAGGIAMNFLGDAVADDFARYLRGTSGPTSG